MWLWVYLVTHSIRNAAEDIEDSQKLREIFWAIPEDLKDYFKRIIEQVGHDYRQEMARYFLVTIFELQPLPLYAFYLLNEEKEHPNYALSASTSELSDDHVREVGKDWKPRLKSRCSDLLIVTDGPHPVFLIQSVDFLHRTVRDFLMDSYQNDLTKELKAPFVAPISLCRIILFFLKKQPRHDPRSPAHLNRMIGLVDELLCYAREAEIHEQFQSSMMSPVAEIHHEVDRVNTALMKGATQTGNHWTNARDPPRSRGQDEYRERGNCNYIALMIQARLVKYVRACLEVNPGRCFKDGRPLLDYALRPRRITPIDVPYHSQRDEPNIDLDMVDLILEKGANPNQVVHSHDDRTVWALFLISCQESVQRAEATDISREAWHEACRKLVERGARNDCLGPGAVQQILFTVFTADQASLLSRRMEQLERDRLAAGIWAQFRGILGMS